MKFSLFSLRTIVTAIVGITTTIVIHATPIVAPYTRWSLFLDGTNPNWVNQYDAYGTTYLGIMKYLRYSTSVQSTLTNRLNMTGKYGSSKFWNGTYYQQISEFGYVGECVGFAKAMTNAGGTSTWVKKLSNALSSIFPNNGIIPNGMTADILLAPGSMIVNFNGATTYLNNQYNHTAIILSLVTNNGRLIGANVVAQNAANTAGGISGADHMISKYFLSWDSGSSLTSLSLKNYHVIEWGII